MRALVLVVILGCTSRAPCEPIVLPASGDVLRGLSFEGYAQNAVVFADGSVGLATRCNDLYELPAGDATGKARSIVEGGSVADLVATGTGDDLYATGESDGVVSLYRLTEPGSRLWAVPINAIEPSQLVAAPEGAYAIRRSSAPFAHTTTTAYAAEDGAFRWTELGLYYPDGSGGLLQIDEVPAGVTPTSATVRSLDASFAVRWTKTLTSANVWVGQPLVTASGAIVLTGGFNGTLDLGDAILSGGSNAGFVAEVDATGKTLWTYALASPTEVTVAGDQVVTLSAAGPLADGLTFDVFDATGHVRTDPLAFRVAGNVDQAVIYEHGAPDGNVWLVLAMAKSSLATLSYILDIGSQHYVGGDAAYLLELAP